VSVEVLVLRLTGWSLLACVPIVGIALPYWVYFKSGKPVRRGWLFCLVVSVVFHIFMAITLIRLWSTGTAWG
jgi:glycerol-3-phosphate acyltransferase PlsY